MKFKAELRLKNGELSRCLAEAGWTSAELAKRSGLFPEFISRILNMKRDNEKTTSSRIISSRTGEPFVYKFEKIRKAFAEVGVFFDVELAWPPGFQGFSKEAVSAETYIDIDARRLEAHAEYQRRMLVEAPVELPDEGLDTEHKRALLHKMLPTLDERERLAVENYLRTGKASTAEIGARFNSSHESVRRHLCKAIHRIRELCGEEEHQTCSTTTAEQRITWWRPVRGLRDNKLQEKEPEYLSLSRDRKWSKN